MLEVKETLFYPEMGGGRTNIEEGTFGKNAGIATSGVRGGKGRRGSFALKKSFSNSLRLGRQAHGDKLCQGSELRGEGKGSWVAGPRDFVPRKRDLTRGGSASTNRGPEREAAPRRERGRSVDIKENFTPALR